MAQTIMCDSDDGMTADVMISQIANGDTIALCGGCLPIWAKGMIDALLPPEPEPIKPKGRKSAKTGPDNGALFHDEGSDRPGEPGGFKGTEDQEIAASDVAAE